MLVTTAFALAPLFYGELSPAHCAPLCDAQSPAFFDRPSAGNWRPTWRTVGEIAGSATVGLAATAMLIEVGLHNSWRDFVVFEEAFLITNSLVIGTGLAARRPRPYLYSERTPLKQRNAGEADLSFMSRHVANAAAVTTALFFTYWYRHPGDWKAWLTLALGGLATGLIGTASVVGGDHFPSDVVLGALVGGSIGALVPHLHLKRTSVQLRADKTKALLQLTYPL